MLSKDVIERSAVWAVSNAINKTEYLCPNIPIGSTEPSWDGDVTIYSDAINHEKKNIKGKVKVQVKGTEKKELVNNDIKFSVEVSDLENYAKTGGVIYFVVYVKPNHNTKIYYQTLTPVKLACILSVCKSQKQKTLDFLPLPDDPIAITRLFIQFNMDSAKQYSFTEENMLTFNNEIDSLSKISLSVSSMGCNGSIEKALLSNEVYLYGMLRENEKIQIPYKMIPKDIIIGKKYNLNIYANDKLFYRSYSVQTSKKKKIICIGNSFKICVYSISNIIKLDINLINTLNERIIDLEFLINIAYNKGFTIDIIKFDLDISEYLDVDRLEKQLKFLKDVKKLFKILHIKKNIDITKLTLNDVNRLNELIAVFVKNDKLTYKEKLTGIVKFSIQDINILLVVKEYDEKKYCYQLEDLFNSSLMFAYSTPNGYDQVTVYSVLCADLYNEISNIDYDNMIEKYKQVYSENKELTSYATNDLLKLLIAYDVSNNSEQLQAAEKLIDWIIEVDEKDSEINSLNKLQILKRKRKLNDIEIEELYNMVEKSDNATEIKLGAYILLENENMAKKKFALLSTDKQAEFVMYPIYKRFGKQLLENTN